MPNLQGCKDRFHVKEGANGPLFGCRYCMTNGDVGKNENAKQVYALLHGGQDHRNGQRAPASALTPTPQPLPTSANDTTYYYTTADGQTAFAIVRQDLSGGEKKISQWTPAGNGLWFRKGPGPARPLYHLKNILTATRVNIVEGEKCVEACLKAWPDKKAVTTWSGGTNAWKQTDWTPLKGRNVVLVADTDDAGRKCMEGLAAYLHGMGARLRPPWTKATPRQMLRTG